CGGQEPPAVENTVLLSARPDGGSRIPGGVFTARWGGGVSRPVNPGDARVSGDQRRATSSACSAQRGRPAGDTVAEAGRRSRLAPRSEGRAQGMNGRISGAAVSFTNASSTTHVSEITRPPGGSLPSGPLPMVASPVFATSSDPRPSNATANGPTT